MPVSTPHPDYRGEHYKLMRACCEGEHAVKDLGDASILIGPVLPKPSGVAALETSSETAQQGADMWEAYKGRAAFAELLGPTIDGLIGLAFRVGWDIEAPDRMKGMLKTVTPDGKSVHELSEYMVREVLQTSRIGLHTDIQEKTKRPVILTYNAETIINWAGNDYPEMVVLHEVEMRPSDGDEFVLKPYNIYRVLRFVDGVYSAEEHTDKKSGAVDLKKGASSFNVIPLEQPSFTGDQMPFVIAGSQNRDLDPDKFIPLWPMARHLLKAYQVSADYYQSLHLTSQATAIFTGVKKKDAAGNDETPTVLGAGTLWAFEEPNAKATYLEFTGAGVEAQKTEIDSQYQLAMQYSHYLTERGAQVESGQALGQKIKTKTASLKSTVINCGYALEEALRSMAIWIGADPNQVLVKPNVQFSDAEIEATMVTAFSNATSMGNMPKKLFWQWLRDVGVTELDDDELEALADEQNEKDEASAMATDNALFGDEAA